MPEQNEEEVIQFYTNPFYIPVQPHTNACSHCSPQPKSQQVAFYTYPCGREHLSHELCLKNYVTSEAWKRGCIFCVKEFGIPLPQVEVELRQHKRVMRCGLIGYIGLLVVIVVGVVFILGFHQRWW
jgi:hypothetical protein